MKHLCSLAACALMIGCGGGGNPATSPTPTVATPPPATAAPTPTPTPTPAPTPTPTPTSTGALSGTWAGTVIATIGNSAARPGFDVTFVVDHTSSGLTGIMSASLSRPGLTARFDLTPAFTGNLTIVFEGKTSVQGGAMQVNTSDSTMTGTFGGTNTDGLAERNVISLRKQ